MGTSIAEPPIPAHVFEQFPSKWVAIRGGEVVAAHEDFERLTEDDRVESTDTLFKVPEPSARFF